ncbi:Positive regulator of purine utilization [Emericellopsis cladophorae]|uniref:Positive regulator of purine utilization n=1 Tax=Emericellopsis cladophorae TaxID=2686198 RepID=A0A9P9Y767_9HYPO|nr:Positive regulator of purine utilization [Emericellopsis cladophorae]KAI6784696.1 Positive regulator of purine utilization [Emericellopsis cladophorae]
MIRVHQSLAERSRAAASGFVLHCDGKVPTCNNCRKAAVDCVEGESVRLGDIPRAQIKSLRHRVQWLESIIKVRCPDVDLTQGDDFEAGHDMTEATPGASVEASRPESEPAHGVDANPRILGRVQDGLSHEIGLVALKASQHPRYLGPSSGHFLARVMLATSRPDEAGWRSKFGAGTSHTEKSMPVELVEALQGPLPFPPAAQARLLCDQYFEIVHPQFPMLHAATFKERLPRVLENPDMDDQDTFQVYMVLALGAMVASHQRRVHLPAESYCLSALRRLERIHTEKSIKGLQCLLLLFVFTIHSSSMKLSVWHLNYQCIAAVIDLGLQRNITAVANSDITVLEQEMRTRILWVVLMLDRRVATMMGRPIGLRDEACDLRLPQTLSDDFTLSGGELSGQTTSSTTAFSLHLFRLTKLNSEIKYVAMSIRRDPPYYAFPHAADLQEWQRNTFRKLNQWLADLPPQNSNNLHIHTICQIQGQSLKMVLLRPSPAIPDPSKDALCQCHEAAATNLRLFGNLYMDNLLVHGWETFYHLVLSCITRIYCIKVVPELASEMDPPTLLADMGDCLGILSATGEHWPGAKRCRDILHDLVRSLVQWLSDVNRTAGTRAPDTAEPRQEQASRSLPADTAWDGSQLMQQMENGGDMATADAPLPFSGRGTFDGWAGVGFGDFMPDSQAMDIQTARLAKQGAVVFGGNRTITPATETREISEADGSICKVVAMGATSSIAGA